MRQIYFALACLLAAAVVSCNKNQEPEEVTVLKVTTAHGTKTHMGASVEGVRPVYWSDGDQLALNGIASTALSGVGETAASADFSFAGTIDHPYCLLYPASFTTTAAPGTITLPETQSWAAGGVATNTMPLVGYLAEGSSVTLSHISTILHLQIKKDPGVSASKLASVTLTGYNSEQVSGDFTLDYEHATLTGTAAAEEGRSVTVTLSQESQVLNESTPLDVFIVVPSNTYTSGFKVVMTDQYNRVMTKQRSTGITLTPGKQVNMEVFTFVPSALATEFTIQDVIEEVLPPDNYNITGRVVDNSGNGLEGVVVSDGTQCIRSACDGTFYMESTIADVKFVHISTPSGYKPTVVNGIPKFYKAKADITPVGGVYDFGDFVVYPVENPNRYTLLITADPQPRSNGWGLDKIAYKSLEVCEDLYDELADVKASITDREVYGICLGDIVHEAMSLYTNYNTGLARLGYPTYNIIGNHDNDPSKANDDAAAATFESYYGPRNYSFNIGGIHFVMLDNLIMKDNGEGNLTAYDQGLTDAIWTWLQNDMAMIPTTTKIMLCAHSPMFKLLKGSERTNSAYHGGTHSINDGNYGYGDLFDKYLEVHAWAGHTHVGFNYIYPSNHRHKKIQVHTLARSTGELWTNEYLAAGTPRGFTVVEVDNGNISWKFHPLTRQRGSFQGVSNGYYTDSSAPSYSWRDWNYNATSHVAEMKVGGGALTEDYQLHAYPRGAYDDDYVYANVFLWDENWELPVWTPDGGAPVTMTRLVSANNQEDVSKTSIEGKIYDAADTEFRTLYKTYANHSGASLAGLSDYRTREVYSADGYIVTMFRAPASASPSSGTVSVTDRFGNTYTRTVSW